jgi:hypothetical protein
VELFTINSGENILGSSMGTDGVVEIESNKEEWSDFKSKIL